MIQLVLSDANAQVREGLAGLLAGDPEIVVGAQVSHNGQLPEAVRRVDPDIVLLSGDARSVDAVDACAALARSHPRVRVIVALSTAKQSTLMAALEAGAQGVVLKDSSPGVLRQAVRSVKAGWSFVDPRLMSKLIQTALRGHKRNGAGGLSSQELRVVQRMLLGLNDAEIARHMGLKETTVRTYVRNATRKLGARDRVEAGTIARREGLV